MWTSFIGFMASGKSTVAAGLVASTSRPGVSVDDVVQETSGSSIAQIFADQGQAGFRKLELEALLGLDSSRNLIVDTGGGVVETPAAVARLRANGVVFWLDCSWEVVRARLRTSPKGVRPLVQELGWAGMEKLFRQRRPMYAAAADFRLQAEAGPEILARTAMLRSIIWQRHIEKSRP
jgi:shikimate kinase